jgi:hypothetical protein
MLQKWSVLGEYSNRSFFPDFHFSLLVCRIHNTYMLASAWNIVSVTLNGFAMDGLADTNIKKKLRDDKDFRQRYLVLYDMVNVLVNMCQDKFSVLATVARAFTLPYKRSH